MEVIVTADGSKTLASAAFGEAYGSRHGALAEALHVYLGGSSVESRLAGGQATRVLEVGFGTGLNFLVTAAAAQRHGTRLHYTAIERDPVDADTLARVYEGSSLPRPLVAELIGFAAATPLTAPTAAPLAAPFALSAHTLSLDGGTVELRLLVGDALALVGEHASAGVTDAAYGVDAVYLDAFSPKSNPELWTPAFLTSLADRLTPGGALVTFSVSGAVRRALEAAGLDVAKRPGPPGGKAQMLVATRPTSTAESTR